MRRLDQLVCSMLPDPPVLAEAIRAGTVKYAILPSGRRLYLISPRVQDMDAVSRAISVRNQRERRITRVAKFVLGVSAAAGCCGAMWTALALLPLFHLTRP